MYLDCNVMATLEPDATAKFCLHFIHSVSLISSFQPGATRSPSTYSVAGRRLPMYTTSPIPCVWPATFHRVADPRADVLTLELNEHMAKHTAQRLPKSDTIFLFQVSQITAGSVHTYINQFYNHRGWEMGSGPPVHNDWQKQLRPHIA